MNSVLSSLTFGVKNKKRARGSISSGAGAPQKKIDLFQDLVHHEENEDEHESDNDVTETDSMPHHGGFRNDDEINEFRNRMRIKVKGVDVPPPAASFRDMDICSELKHIILQNIEQSQWKEPTPIQMQVIPPMLQGRDILATAPTGSGKTAAFVIPTLSKLQAPRKQGIRALLLAPTRELAEQIFREALRLCTGRNIRIGILKKASVSAAMHQEEKASYSKYDCMVATPMRLVALIRAEAIDLSHVTTVVMDEADKLFEVDTSVQAEEENDITRSAFLTQVDEILSMCSSDNIQRALFSATIGPLVRELADGFLVSPVHVTVGVENAGATTIKQKLLFVGREDGKLLAIRQLVQAGLRPPVLLFVQSKERAKELFRELVYDGINVDVMHADRTEQQREQVITRFRTGDIWVLICTDLMARGIDFKGVRMVINYDLPQSAVSYIHRIGRTGRAGREGEAITLFTEEDMPKLRSIANVMKLSGCEVPDWILSIKQLKTKEKRHLRKLPPKRRAVTTVSKYDKVKSRNKKQSIENTKRAKLEK